LGQAVANLGKAFGSAITGQGNQAKQEAAKAGENVSGPVGIYAVLKQGASLGYQFVLFVVAIISLTLAIMNALPIPALDGGRAAVMLAFRAAKKPLKQRTEEMIHGIGFATLMALFVIITIVDIRRFF
jgi:regulator of sigma E protease